MFLCMDFLIPGDWALEAAEMSFEDLTALSFLEIFLTQEWLGMIGAGHPESCFAASKGS